MSPTALLLLGFRCVACRRLRPASQHLSSGLLYLLISTHHSLLITHTCCGACFVLLRRRLAVLASGLPHLINKVIVLKLSCYLFQIIGNACINQLISCLNNKTTNDIFINHRLQFYILHFSC